MNQKQICIVKGFKRNICSLFSILYKQISSERGKVGKKVCERERKRKKDQRAKKNRIAKRMSQIPITKKFSLSFSFSLFLMFFSQTNRYATITPSFACIYNLVRPLSRSACSIFSPFRLYQSIKFALAFYHVRFFSFSSSSFLFFILSLCVSVSLSLSHSAFVDVHVCVHEVFFSLSLLLYV